MARKPFNKPAISIAEQIEQLRSRGMEIPDQAAAELHIRHINYYRLGAYWLPFEADHATHSFKEGTTFQQVLDLYIFDREFRILVLDAIERIEVSLRAVWAHTLAMEYGPHAHLDSTIVRDASRWRDFLSTVLRELGRSNEVFIKHMLDRYVEVVPPIWATCEIMTLGSLSKWFENTGPKRTKTKIADVYGLNQDVLESWCKHLTYVRNICAHHSRLWNREFTITPAVPRTIPAAMVGQVMPNNRGVYNTLVILLHMMDTVSPDHTWRKRLKALLRTCVLELAHMGFPNDWEVRPIWTSTP